MSDAQLPPWPYGLSLRVGISTIEPYERLHSAKHSKLRTLRDLADEMVIPRLDLVPSQSWADRSAALSVKSRTVADLRRRGHRVNGVGVAYHVYVIELADQVGTKTGDQLLPWLYVGESSKEPLVRIQEHRSGSRNQKGPLFSRVAHKHFVRGRPDLYRSIPPVFDKAEAIEVERQTAAELRSHGYSVRCG
jgi:hypothetical protein